MTGRVGGMKPWQVQHQKPDAKPDHAPTDAKDEAAGGASMVDEVLLRSHRAVDEAKKARFKKTDFRNELATAGAVELIDDKLSVGGKTYALSHEQQKAMSLLGPNARLAAGLAAGIEARSATLVSAAEGSGASHTVRWLLDVIDEPHAISRISRITSIDQLVGSLRPDAKGHLRVQNGPLTERILRGGVFVADGIDQADKDVLALLKTLAKGSASFHHPVSGRVIKVHEDFRLVLVSSSQKHVASDLLDVCNLVEVPAYSEAEHARLLVEQYGLPAELCERLAGLHAKVQQAVAKGDLELGRGFPVAWPLLARVGNRLARLESIDDADVCRALWGVYGARLTGERVAILGELITKAGFGELTLGKPRHSKDETFVKLPSQERAAAFAQSALDAGEVLLLNGPGQSGTTRLVAELAAVRKQELVTVPCHGGTDPLSLIERPLFKEDGSIEFKRGIVADALLTGKMVYFDHVDHIPPERQAALFRLAELKTIPVLENGVIVDKPVHEKARVVFAMTTGAHRSRRAPPALERSRVTEVLVGEPSLEDVLRLVPAGMAAPLRDELTRVAQELHADNPKLGLTKMQRFLDFAGAAQLLAQHVTVDQAVARAAAILFDPQDSAALRRLLPKAPESQPPLWMKLMGLSQKDVDTRLAKTGYVLVDSMREHLLPLAVAYHLRRPVLAVGPASSGKTVLGAVWSALVEKNLARVNFSASTEGRDLFGGLAPVNVDGRTVFRHVEAPLMRVGQSGDTWMGDESKLSPDGPLPMKPALDARRTVYDAESGLSRGMGSSLLYFADNALGTRGRHEHAPTVTDCMIHLTVRAKHAEEKATIVGAQCGLERAALVQLAELYGRLEMLVEDRRKKNLASKIAPVTCTERDMLKVARTVEYLQKRDGVRGDAKKTELLARETYRMVKDLVQSDADRAAVLDLVKTHFGVDLDKLPRPGKPEIVEVKEGGKTVRMLQIGVARYPVRDLSQTPELLKLVPTLERVGAPVGEQMEFLESVLLAIETNQPLAIVGATGTGKTMLVKYLAHHLNQPVLEQPYFNEMTEDHLFGATALRPDGKVEFKHSALGLSAMNGCWYVGDELLTLSNRTREALNPVTEGSEIQIPSRPARTLRKKDGPEADRWHPEFRVIFTTNGDDIREDGFSEPEASRLRIIGLRDFSTLEELREVALRDYGPREAPEGAYEPPPRTADSREILGVALLELCSANSLWSKLSAKADSFPAALRSALSGEEVDLTKLGPAPSLQLDASGEQVVADILSVFTHDKKDAPVRELVGRLLAACTDDASCTRVVGMVGSAGLPEAVLARADKAGVVGDRLTSADEVERGTRLFFELRGLQGQGSRSPLTPRLLSSFFELYIEKRRQSGPAAAAIGAAQLALLSKMGPAQEGKALAKVVEIFSQAEAERIDDLLPRHAESSSGIRFGRTLIDYGADTRFAPDHRRFPLTEARVRNLALLADAVAMGRGRPISITDDPNGESIDTLREFGRLTGQRLLEVTLTPNIDIEGLIEKLVLSEDPKALSGFVPELQQIGQAVREGHLLVLRGCGSIPSAKLERLNSLGDGRRSVELPRSAETLRAAPGFRMVMMRKPDAPHRYSPALENRLVEPLLTTRVAGQNAGAVQARAEELFHAVQRRTQISADVAKALARLHVTFNELLRAGVFTSGAAVGSFLNRDAEAVGRRLKWLLDHNAVDDERAGLMQVVCEVYGERFEPEADRALIEKLTRDLLQLDATPAPAASEPTATRDMVRFGEWALRRDGRGVRDGVPGADADLPLRDSLQATHRKTFAALAFREAVHFHGDSFVARATVRSIARLTQSRILEVEGNEELNEAHLFGGTIQNEKGEFEHYEGLVWEAQREGAVLFVRNASRIPVDLLMRLQEIAVSDNDNISRIKDGKLETQEKHLRLVLQTSPHDLPLAQDLAAVCTRVRCEPITDHKELVRLVSHMLLGVPGGAEIASALVTFAREAKERLEKEAFEGRQPIVFDSGRLLLATTEIAARARQENASLEQVLADALTRHYLRPVSGLACAEKIGAAVEAFADTVYGDNGILTAQMANPLDLVTHPHLASLKQDYDHIAPSFTSELLRGGADALAAALEQRDIDGLRSALQLLVDSPLVPSATAKRLETVVQELGKKLGDEDEKKLQGAIRHLRQAAGEESKFEEVGLEFVRGARLWDLEHRLELVGRYETAFAALAQVGSASAQHRLGLLQRIRERFDTAGAERVIREGREAVRDAMTAYAKHGGQKDKQLIGLYDRVIERWDWVSVTPIFKGHHQLRSHLVELNGLLEELRTAYATRSDAPPEVEQLVRTIAGAGALLEGLRIAEQSADFRRDVRQQAVDTQTLVGNVKQELDELMRLNQAEATYNTLASVFQLTQRLTGGAFMQLDLSDSSVKRPELKTAAQIADEARAEARVEVASIIEKKRQQLLVAVQAASDSEARPSAGAFFNGYDLDEADVGRTAASTHVPGRSKPQALYTQGMKDLEREAERLLEESTERFKVELKNADEERARELYKQRVASRSSELAANVSRSARELIRGIEQCLETMPAERRDATIEAELRAAQVELEKAAAYAEDWAARTAEVFTSMGAAMLRAMSFGLIDTRPDANRPPPPDLDAAKAAARAALRKLGKHVETHIGGLADFKQAPKHKEQVGNLSDALLASETLGQLASRYALIADVAGKEQVDGVRQVLNALLGKMAKTGDTRDLLAKVMALSNTADVLSTRLATKNGVQVEVAPVLESIMKAVQVVRSHSLGERSHRAPVKALESALLRIDELETSYKSGGAELPPALVVVRTQMNELIEAMDRASGTVRGSLRRTDVGVGDVLDGLLSRFASAQSAGLEERETQVVMVKDTGAELPEQPMAEAPAKLIEAQRAMVALEGGAVEAAVRETALTVVKIDFGRAMELAEPATIDKAEKADPELGARRQAVRGELQRLVELARAQTSGDAAALDSVKRELVELEKAVGGLSLQKARERLEDVDKVLGRALEGGGGYRGKRLDVAEAIGMLRKVGNVLSGLELVPTALAQKIRGLVEAAAPLAGSLEQEGFGAKADTWCDAARVLVRRLGGELAEVGRKLRQSSEPPTSESLKVSLERLAEAAKAVAEKTGRFGAFERAQLLQHLEQRLRALEAGLPAAMPGELAVELAELAGRAAKAQAAIAGGADGGQSIVDIYEALIDLAERLLAAKTMSQADVEAYQRLAGSSAELVARTGRAPSDGADVAGAVEVLGRAIETLQHFRGHKASAVVRVAAELDLSLGSLRSGLLRGELETQAARLAATASPFLDRVAAARAQLSEAAAAFVGFDPAGEAKLADVASEVRAGLTAAAKELTGPLAVLLWRDAESLKARLETLLGQGALAEQARELVFELDPILRSAGPLASVADAPERFASFLATARAQLDKKSPPTLVEVERAGGMVDALIELTTTPIDDLQKRMDEVEARFFTKPEEPAAPVVTKKGKADTAKASQEPITVLRSEDRPLTAAGGQSRPHGQAEEVDLETQGALTPVQAKGAERDESLGEIKREAADPGKLTELSGGGIQLIKSDAADFAKLKKEMDDHIAAMRAQDVIGVTQRTLNPYEEFVAKNEDLVEEIAQALRQFPNTEVVILVDQSGSTGERYGDSVIYEQERAAAALVMAAITRSESNCAVLGFDDKVFSPHKDMRLKLDAQSADVAFGKLAGAYGGTNIMAALQAAPSQFSSKANNKLVMLLTDCAVNGGSDIQHQIETMRQGGVGVAVMGFGDAQNVKSVAGEFGLAVQSFSQAVKGAAKLLEKTIVANQGRFKGQMEAAGGGIGESRSQTPMGAAPSLGPMESSLRLAHGAAPQADPAEAFAAQGPRRELTNLVDRSIYDRAVAELERIQAKALSTSSLARCLQVVRDTAGRHAKEGVIEGLRQSISMSLPKSGGAEWERKQTSGPLLDEDQLPLYVVGLEQGVPVSRIFKRKKSREEIKAKVVLMIDESSSMGDSDKMLQNLEALFAYGDALKAVDPEIEIAVVGFSDKVRLHAHFEQEWGEKLKAHLLHQVRGQYDATDDERGGMEAVGLLDLVEPEVGQIVGFSDGQGMPGTPAVMTLAAQRGYSFVTVGVGPECKAVKRFGDHGLYVRNLSQLVREWPTAALKAWEKANRLVE